MGSRRGVSQTIREKTQTVIDATASSSRDILHVCIESELADVHPPGFFTSKAYCYVKGHFPCGCRALFHTVASC